MRTRAFGHGEARPSLGPLCPEGSAFAQSISVQGEVPLRFRAGTASVSTMRRRVLGFYVLCCGVMCVWHVLFACAFNVCLACVGRM